MLWGHYSKTGVLTNVACSEHNQHSVPQISQIGSCWQLYQLDKGPPQLVNVWWSLSKHPWSRHKAVLLLYSPRSSQPLQPGKSGLGVGSITHYPCCCCCGAAPGFEWRPAACIAIACQTMNTFVAAEADQRPSFNIPPNMYQSAPTWPSQYIF